jgi:hypothetical protein
MDKNEKKQLIGFSKHKNLFKGKLKFNQSLNFNFTILIFFFTL